MQLNNIYGGNDHNIIANLFNNHIYILTLKQYISTFCRFLFPQDAVELT